jgi:hypothetical protein
LAHRLVPYHTCSVSLSICSSPTTMIGSVLPCEGGARRAVHWPTVHVSVSQLHMSMRLRVHISVRGKTPARHYCKPVCSLPYPGTVSLQRLRRTATHCKASGTNTLSAQGRRLSATVFAYCCVSIRNFPAKEPFVYVMSAAAVSHFQRAFWIKQQTNEPAQTTLSRTPHLTLTYF